MQRRLVVLATWQRYGEFAATNVTGRRGQQRLQSD
jgi:hypothetical protein